MSFRQLLPDVKSKLKVHLMRVALALCIALMALGAMPSGRVYAAPTGTLRVGWTSPTNLDPALFADAPDISVGVAVYDYLITLDQKSTLVPSLASRGR